MGDKGKLYFNRGRTNWLVTGRDKDEVSQISEETAKSVPRTKDEDFEWIEGIKGGPTPLSHFAHSGPFTETVLLGNLALRCEGELQVDGKNLKCTNNKEANKFINKD